MSYLFVFPILVPAAGGFFVWRIRSDKARRAATVLTLLLTLGAVIALCAVRPPAVTVWDAGNLSLRFGCDGISLLFLPLVCAVFLASAIFSLAT